MTTHAFTSMGCEIVVGGASPAEAQAIERLFAERDETFSRFRRDSELSRVNASTSNVVSVSPAFAEMVAIALRAAASTGGLVDPTLGEAIEAAGYDRDFGRLGPSPSPPRPAAPGRWRAVRASECALSRPIGVRLDLNGVVKSKTVDDALELISGDGFVSAGGDIAARGALDVALPGGDAVRLVAGGLATSGSAKRRWLRGGAWQHHLIDPRNGRAGTIAVGRGHDLRGDVPSVRRCGQGGFPARPRRSRVSRRARPRRSLSRALRRDRLHAAMAVVRASRGVNGVAWEAARAGGIVAYVLLSSVVVIGLALSGRERLAGWPRFAVEDVHRFVGMLVGAFVSLHVVTIAIDSEAHFSVLQLVVPFASSYRPLWTGLGIVAAELLVALAVANHYRTRISYRLWRRLHYLNFAVWLAATWHGIGAGTDSGSTWLLWIYVGAIGAVALFTARRILRTAPPVSA